MLFYFLSPSRCRKQQKKAFFFFFSYNQILRDRVDNWQRKSLVFFFFLNMNTTKIKFSTFFFFHLNFSSPGIYPTTNKQHRKKICFLLTLCRPKKKKNENVCFWGKKILFVAFCFFFIHGTHGEYL